MVPMSSLYADFTVQSYRYMLWFLLEVLHDETPLHVLLFADGGQLVQILLVIRFLVTTVLPEKLLRCNTIDHMIDWLIN